MLHGIVNGIDTEVWNPETDPLLAAPYSAPQARRAAPPTAPPSRSASACTPTARALFVAGQPPDLAEGHRPARLDHPPATSSQAGHRLAVLGSGDAGARGRPSAPLAAQHPGRVGVVIGYDEPLSHTMQGGGDAILIPSRFEPCGLTQLYGLRYGCVPIVARIGGLADTVIDANVAALERRRRHRLPVHARSTPRRSPARSAAPPR